MADQLDRVLAVERQKKVTFQIVPFDLGAHAAQDSNFILFEFEEKSDSPLFEEKSDSPSLDEKSDSPPFEEKSKLSPVVFVEALTGNHYLEKEADIGRYREVVEYLRDNALSPRHSVQRLTEIKEIYKSGQHPASVGCCE